MSINFCGWKKKPSEERGGEGIMNVKTKTETWGSVLSVYNI